MLPFEALVMGIVLRGMWALKGVVMVLVWQARMHADGPEIHVTDGGICYAMNHLHVARCTSQPVICHKSTEFGTEMLQNTGNEATAFFLIACCGVDRAETQFALTVIDVLS